MTHSEIVKVEKQERREKRRQEFVFFRIHAYRAILMRLTFSIRQRLLALGCDERDMAMLHMLPVMDKDAVLTDRSKLFHYLLSCDRV